MATHAEHLPVIKWPSFREDGSLPEDDFVADESERSGIKVEHEGEEKAITVVIQAFEAKGDDYRADLYRSMRRALMEAKQMASNVEALLEAAED